eukprot:CAMPEP_0202966372 /NCGR_PEP_ID=MMETSP1396-20130829/10750_1 /ASSEMBLY_ACC=CAM_ASM_000872 /TAXON_ID= /ORGANISM="Pseudokeronopsis sp., Strain Brazil" /LENGTH=45 /DNA_ID= /DNA_START= /DNA_END= /DNA_ORIENTATION=
MTGTEFVLVKHDEKEKIFVIEKRSRRSAIDTSTLAVYYILGNGVV